MSKNTFEIDGDTISITRPEWGFKAYATIREDYLDEILPLFDEDMDISVNVNIDKSLEESEYKILISLTQVEES